MSENGNGVNDSGAGSNAPETNDSPMADNDSRPYQRYGGDRRGPRNGGGSGRCYNCGMFGHMSYDCHKRGGHMSYGRSRGPQRCYNCNREGHISRECQAPPGAKACYNCNEEGHLSRDCTQPRKERPKTCFNCNEVGHIAAQCPCSK